MQSRTRAGTTVADPGSLRRHAVRGLAVAGALLVLATILDFVILWGFQAQETLQWEFVASTNTLEGLPRMALGLGLVYAALGMGRSASVGAYRVVGILAILTALVAAALGALIIMDYFPMRAATAEGAATALLESSTVKSVGLALLHVVFLLPAGLLGLKRP